MSIADTPPPAPKRLDRMIGGGVFGTDPEGYDAGRIGYPDAMFAAIRDYCGEAPQAIVEAGPGTGISTRGLLAMDPQRLVAVEPDPVLAARLSEALADPRVEVVAASFAEAEIAGKFDLGAAASSFHWMDADKAFARYRVLLNPGAPLALWWNSYRQPGIGDPLADALASVLADYALAPSEGVSGHYSLDVVHHTSAMAAAGFTGLSHHIIRRERELTRAQLQALYASYSFVRALDPETRTALLAEIDRIAESRFGDRAPNIVVTALYLGRAPV